MAVSQGSPTTATIFCSMEDKPLLGVYITDRKAIFWEYFLVIYFQTKGFFFCPGSHNVKY